MSASGNEEILRHRLPGAVDSMYDIRMPRWVSALAVWLGALFMGLTLVLPPGFVLCVSEHDGPRVEFTCANLIGELCAEPCDGGAHDQVHPCEDLALKADVSATRPNAKESVPAPDDFPTHAVAVAPRVDQRRTALHTREPVQRTRSGAVVPLATFILRI